MLRLVLVAVWWLMLGASALVALVALCVLAADALRAWRAPRVAVVPQLTVVRGAASRGRGLS